MMLRKSTVAALSVLVAVATAHPYAEWNSARYRWNDLLTARDEEVGARVRSQATIETCSCALVTETWDSESYSVRVCTADCPNKVCWETSVDRCNPTAYFSLGYLVSSTQVSVAGEYVAVEFYLTHAGVCFRLDDAHLRAETCSRKSDSCLLSCPECPDRPPNPPDLPGTLETPTPTPETETPETPTPGTPIPGTTTPVPPCNQPQNLFFFIDATVSNKFENFCPLIIVLQMMVAAFSPSPSSGIQIRSLLFSDNAKHREPSPVFETDTSCLNAVQGKDGSLLSLMQEFGICLDEHRKYNSWKFPSMCGEGTSAVLGLERIRDIARNIARTKSARKSTVLMITDGTIEDGEKERTKVLNDLESAGVTIIEAGYGDADLSTMKLYADPDNIMIGNDPVELAKAIVNKLKVKGALCDEYAKNVTKNLERAQGSSRSETLDLFCRCHRMTNINKAQCINKKYPVCGGDLSFGLINPTGMSKTLNFQATLESDLEEEILAAVENVLERFNGH